MSDLLVSSHGPLRSTDSVIRFRLGDLAVMEDDVFDEWTEVTVK
jgi:hypothetical protein